MDRADFESRPWVSSTGWPISYDEMQAHYEVAAELCQLESAGVLDDPARQLPAVYRPPFTGGDVEIATWRGSPPTHFGRVYRQDLASASNVMVYTHATAVEVLTDDVGGAAAGVRVVSNTGAEFQIAASTVVLCAGAIETARLLLASRRVHPGGLGNENDLVGRFFMEHPHLVTARLHLLPLEMVNRPDVKAINPTAEIAAPAREAITVPAIHARTPSRAPSRRDDHCPRRGALPASAADASSTNRSNSSAAVL